MREYLKVLAHVLENGEKRDDRTGTGTISLFAQQMEFDLQKGFPLLTTKKIHLRSVVHELLWFLSGETNIQYLKEHQVRIWDEWADENGELGPVYGKQWRRWQTPEGFKVDQISQVMESLRQDPESRRHIVVAWNPADVPKMALPPCHALFQFYVSEKKRLSCQLYARSTDLFLGCPFNVASYSLLTHMMAQQLDLDVGKFVMTMGDAHIYTNHVDQVQLQLSREPRELPTLKIARKPKDLFSYRFEDFVFEGYDPHPTIKAPVAV